jgi:hypothetical protein
MIAMVCRAMALSRVLTLLFWPRELPLATRFRLVSGISTALMRACQK